jgi:virulence-associated protein VagC
MRTKVTEAGVLIPKQWLEGIDEVEIRKEDQLIIIVPIRADDPILTLGTQPIIDDVDDASTNHDRYLTDR